MKVLVTGGGGFIGRHMAHGLSDYWNVQAPQSNKLDLTDERAVENYLKRHRFDAVIHAATWNATSTSSRDLSLVLKQNLRMFYSLFRCRNLYGCMIYYGSGAEFDRRAWDALMPESRFGNHIPEDDYGFSKYIMECAHGPADAVWNLRLFGVFGPGEDWRIRFISNACCRTLLDLPIKIRQNRRFDYTWVGDIVEVTRRVLQDPPSVRTLNVSAGIPMELRSLAELVLHVSGKDLPIQIETPGFGAEYSADVSLMHQQLPGLFFTPIEEGIGRLYSWYSEHRDLIRPEQL